VPNYYTSPLLTDIADGAQILNSASEALMCPDFGFGGNDNRIFQGAYFNIRASGDVSNVVTTPGTLTFRLRWGGLAGTLLAASQAITLDITARANFSYILDIDLAIRSIGSAGSMFAQGFVLLNDTAVGAAAAPQYYTMGSAGANVPAAVGSLDTTTAKLLSLTAQFSVATATTQLTNHMRRLTTISS
jgi:hypothetical protein